MQLAKRFDSSQHDPSQSAGQLPVGKHPVIISESEVMAAKDVESGLLELTLQIIDGPSKGQTGPYRLNLYNKSAKAAEIAHKQMSAICHVTGVYVVDDSRQLHNIPFIIEVGLQRDAEAAAKGYTEVKRVYDINGNEPGKQNAGGGQPATGQGAPGGGAWGGGSNGAQQQPPAPDKPAWGGGGAPAGNGGAPATGGGAWNAGGGNAGGGAPAGEQASKPAWAK